MEIAEQIAHWLPIAELPNWVDWGDFEAKLHHKYMEDQVLPPQSQILRCLELTPFSEVKVVILGQDPYHGAGQAHGLSFSVPYGCKVPPSLRNIFKELASIGVVNGNHGCLEFWAEQGVLLLNTVLTVREGEAGSHRQIGWEEITGGILQALNKHAEHVVFMLWGKDAARIGTFLNPLRHCILTAPHPSPLSSYRGFFGCGHFASANEYLEGHGRMPIQWTLPDKGLFHD